MSFIGDIFSGVTDTLFGTEGTPAQIIDTTPSEFQELREPTSGSLQDIIGSISGGGQFDPGGADLSRLFAPISGAEQGFVDQLSTTGISGLQTQGRDVLSNILGGGNLDPNNPILQRAIEAAIRPINQRNEENQAALIGQFKRAGATLRTDPNRVGSSAFLNQARLLERDRINTIGDVGARIQLANLQAGRAEQERAVEGAERISTQDINSAIQKLQAVALPRLIKDLGIQRGLAEFNDRIQRLLNALQLSGGLQTKTPQTLPAIPGQTGAIPDLISGGLTGAAGGLLQKIPGIGSFF